MLTGSALLISPKDAIDKVNSIMASYIAANQANPKSWAASAQTELAAFNDKFPTHIGASLNKIKQCTLTMADKFVASAKLLFGFDGNSKLRNDLITAANSWPTQEQYLESRVVILEESLRRKDRDHAEDLVKFGKLREEHEKLKKDLQRIKDEDADALAKALQALKVSHATALEKEQQEKASLRQRLEQATRSLEILKEDNTNLVHQITVVRQLFAPQPNANPTVANACADANAAAKLEQGELRNRKNNQVF